MARSNIESPMFKRVRETREQNPNCVCLFRMGDFWEAFFDDALIVARVLGLALTTRDKGDNSIPMSGFPHHCLDGYLRKLVAAGHRVALCEQAE